MMKDERDNRVEDGIEQQTVDVGDIRAETGEHRASGEAGIATDRERTERLALLRTREAVYHARGFRMIDG